MTIFSALVASTLVTLVLLFSQFGHFIAFHSALHQRAEALAKIEAARLHKGEVACLSLPVDVSRCWVEGNIATVEVRGEIQLFGRQFSLKNRASVGNQWVEFTDSSLP